MNSGSESDRDALLTEGKKIMRTGKFDEAEQIFRSILEDEPQEPDALHLLGLVRFQIGYPEEAVTFINQAIAHARPNEDYLYNLGRIYKMTGRLADALEKFQQALVLKPDYTDAHINLGDTLKELGRLEDAVDCYRKALDIKPDFAEALNNLGNMLKALRRLDEAIASYHKAIAIKPDFAEAHNNLGNALKDFGELDEATSSYQQALAIKPDFAEAHSNLGNVLNELGRQDEALASFHKALAIKPDYAVGHFNLGNVLEKLGRLEDAVGTYQKAINLNPEYAEAWNNFKFATRAFQFLNADRNRTGETGAAGLNDVARASIGFAIQQFYLAGFRPHEADKSFEKVITALPAKAEEAIPIDGPGGQPAGVFQLADKIVALLHFGRSGTGLLHSLIDGHPEISTLPSIYLRGYFNEGVWDKISAGGWRELPDRFADEFAVLFDADSPKPIPSRLEEPSFFVGRKEGMTAVGEKRNEKLSLDRGAFCAEALRLIEGLETVDPMSFLLVVHAAFERVMGTDTKKPLCFYHIHNPDEYAKPNFLRYAPTPGC